MNPSSIASKLTVSASRPFRTNIFANLSSSIQRHQQRMKNNEEIPIDNSDIRSPIFPRRNINSNLENCTPNRSLFSPSIIRQHHLHFQSNIQGSPSFHLQSNSNRFNSKRKLFIDSGIESTTESTTNSIDELYNNLMDRHQKNKEKRWNFDFHNNLPKNQSTPFDRLKWKEFKNPPNFFNSNQNDDGNKIQSSQVKEENVRKTRKKPSSKKTKSEKDQKVPDESASKQLKITELFPIRKKKRNSIQMTIESAQSFLETPKKTKKAQKSTNRPLTRLQKRKQQKDLFDCGITMKL
ncbi:hypothetical protein SNEBB_010311 [Seison nebaliae]|nr:hypothetical protein SNEBB_010311 [Seison nebaliae]